MILVFDAGKLSNKVVLFLQEEKNTIVSIQNKKKYPEKFLLQYIYKISLIELFKDKRAEQLMYQPFFTNELAKDLEYKLQFAVV